MTTGKADPALTAHKEAAGNPAAGCCTGITLFLCGPSKCEHDYPAGWSCRMAVLPCSKCGARLFRRLWTD
jgi:hypothetical protein